jgi:ssDNA-binding Zn-finger/Zn-ribbon topoisomerase 1
MFSTACPACSTPMRARMLERMPHGQASIDLCDGCGGMWFDQHESLQLTPGATLELFREVAAVKLPTSRATPARLPCPRCSAPLAETQDLQRTTRFRYWRCGRGHGRYTPYLQFLLEKNFIRPLSPAEFERLKGQVKSVRCSGCGAAVDLERSATCSYCRVPIVALDGPGGALSRHGRARAHHHRRRKAG